MMHQKERTAPLSTVLTLAAAVVIGNFLLPAKPGSSHPPHSQVVSVSTYASPAEVPISESGRAFERLDDAPVRATTKSSTARAAGSVSTAASAAAEKELTTFWELNEFRAAHHGVAVSDEHLLFIVLLLAACAIGFAAFRLDHQDAVHAEECKEHGQVVACTVPEAPSWTVPLIACLTSLLLATSAAVGAGFFSEAASRTSMALPAAEVELRSLLSPHQPHLSMYDRASAAAVVLAALLGLQAALSDRCDIDVLGEDQATEKEKPKLPDDVDVIDRRCVQCGVLGVALAAAGFVILYCWQLIAGFFSATGHCMAAPAVIDSELSNIAASASRNIRWAPSDEATIAVLGATAVLALIPSAADVLEEANKTEPQEMQTVTN